MTEARVGGLDAREDQDKVWPVKYWVTLPSDVSARLARMAADEGVSREDVIHRLIVAGLAR